MLTTSDLEYGTQIHRIRCTLPFTSDFTKLSADVVLSIKYVVRLAPSFDIRSETFSPEAVVTNTGVFEDMLKATVSDFPQIAVKIAFSIAPAREKIVFNISIVIHYDSSPGISAIHKHDNTQEVTFIRGINGNVCYCE